MLGTIEDIVGGDLDRPTAPFSNGCSQISRGLGIQLRAQFLIILGLVDCRISRAVDDAINGVVLYKRLDGGLVSDIQLCHIRIKIGMLGMTSLQQLHFVSQLAITAGDQYIHLQFDNLQFTIYGQLINFTI